MGISYVTMVREESATMYKFAEVKYGKIVSINEHWVPLDEYVKFFDAGALFIDITDVKIEGEEPMIGDVVTTGAEGYVIKHVKHIYSPAEYKAYIVEKMKMTRDKKELEPIFLTVDGVEYLFDADEDANVRIAKARQLMEDNGIQSVTWTTFDNQHVDLKLEDFKAINTAQAVRSVTLHNRYNELKQYIYSLEDNTALDDLTWDTEIAK